MLKIIWISIFCLHLSLTAEPIKPGFGASKGDTSSVAKSGGIVPWKLATLTTLSLATGMVTYYFVLENAWWEKETTGFQFKNDFDYALNVDKAGHFFGGMVVADILRGGFQWSGMNEVQSHVFASGASAFIQAGIDYKDGFSSWGYSPWDVALGAIGSTMPIMDRYVPGMNWIDVKMSYWKNSNAYYNRSEIDFVGDDYLNQTYWASFKINNALPSGAERLWPDFIALALGVSVNEDLYTRGVGHGKREFYFSLDWDLEAIAPTNRFLSRNLHFLNYIKFPSPSLQVYPKWKMHWAYPIIF